MVRKASGRPFTCPGASAGFSKADLSTWLGLVVLLLLGWIVVMPFVAAGPITRPLVVGTTGVIFSVSVATIMMRAFRGSVRTDESASTTTPTGTSIFAYPLLLCRLLRFGLVLCPLILVLSFIGLVGGLGEQSPMFMVAMVVAGLGLLLTWYVSTRLVGEVRLSRSGLHVRMVSGRSISIGWHEIDRLRISPTRDRFRVETKTGLSFSIEGSLPGYPRLLRLIEQHLEQRDTAG